jgi:hypothetical protein
VSDAALAVAFAAHTFGVRRNLWCFVDFGQKQIDMLSVRMRTFHQSRSIHTLIAILTGVLGLHLFVCQTQQQQKVTRRENHNRGRKAFRPEISNAFLSR